MRKNKPTKQHAQRIKTVLPFLEEWSSTISELDEQVSRVRSLFQFVESPLTDAIDKTANQYTKMVSQVVGDRCDWLFWFWHENDMGARGYEVWPQGVQKPYVKVNNLHDLAYVISFPEEV